MQPEVAPRGMTIKDADVQGDHKIEERTREESKITMLVPIH